MNNLMSHYNNDNGPHNPNPNNNGNNSGHTPYNGTGPYSPTAATATMDVLRDGSIHMTDTRAPDEWILCRTPCPLVQWA